MKKNEKKLMEEWVTRQDLRWEFIRRNKKYQQDYDRWVRSGRKAGFASKIYQEYDFYPVNYALNLQAIKKVSENQSDIERDQLKKYGKVKICFSPDVENFFNSFFKDADYLVREISGSREILNKTNFNRMKFKNLYGNRIKASDINTLKIYINVNYPKEELLREISDIIENFQNKKPKLNRLRLLEYKRYLAVYDLRLIGWSLEKLAKKFYKNDRNGLDYAKLKIKRDYKRCEEMILRGYKQIR